jgi:hypothetical protein
MPIIEGRDLMTNMMLMSAKGQNPLRKRPRARRKRKTLPSPASSLKTRPRAIQKRLKSRV